MSESTARSEAKWPELSRWPRLAQLMAQARAQGGARTGVVYPLSSEALGAACQAHHLGLIQAVLYGPEAKIQALANSEGLSLQGMTLVDTPNNGSACAHLAVHDCKREHLQALMKGSLQTDELLSAVVARDGLRTARRVSHVFVFDVPAYHKILLLSDAVVNISPDLKAKRHIVQNAIDAARMLGIVRPKVALVAAVEGVHPEIPATMDAALLIGMSTAGQITGGVLGGPFGLDNAISLRAAQIKKIQSDVVGDTDVLIAPELNAGNMLYKSLVYLGQAECAGVVVGAQVPVILTSRADSVTSRIASCALATLLTDMASLGEAAT